MGHRDDGAMDHRRAAVDGDQFASTFRIPLFKHNTDDHSMGSLAGSALSNKRPIAIAVLLMLLTVLPVVYIAGYFVAMESGGQLLVVPNRPIVVAPSFKFGGNAAEYLFWPAYLADREIRPERWKYEPPEVTFR